MSNIKSFAKIIKPVVSKIEKSSRCLNGKLHTGTVKAEKELIQIPIKEDDRIHKIKKDKYIRIKDGKISMKDPAPHTLSIYNENKDDYELVKHIEVLQKFADRYNDVYKNVGPIKTNVKSKPKGNKIKSNLWNETMTKQYMTLSSESKMHRFKDKKPSLFITLADEPKLKTDDPVLAKPIIKKPILLYTIGLKNVESKKKVSLYKKLSDSVSLNKFKECSIKSAVEENKIKSVDDVRDNFVISGAGIAAVASMYKDTKTKPKIFPDQYKPPHNVVTRSYTTNKIKSNIQSGISYFQNGILVRTIMKQAEHKETANVDDSIKFSSIYHDKTNTASPRRKKVEKLDMNLKESLIAKRKLEKPELNISDSDARKVLNKLNLKNKKINEISKNNTSKLTRNINENFIAKRKTNIYKKLDEELKPMMYPKTSLLIKQSHLPITKCKRMTESSDNKSHTCSEKDVINHEKTKTNDTHFQLHESAKQNNRSIIKRLLNFFDVKQLWWRNKSEETVRWCS